MTARKILLTGASRGLGRAMLADFAAAGQTVWGCATSEAAIEGLRRDFPPPHDFQVVDVADDGQVRAWAERAQTARFVPDLLLNNAAVVNRNALLWKVPREEFDRLLAVNVGGMANVVRHFVPAMIARGRGTIVNFSSGWGRSVSAEVAPYCASKFAVEGLTRALAEELPAGMAAVPLNPGIIDTDMLRSCFGGDAADYPEPAEWAKRAVPFLLRLGPGDNGRSLSVE